MGTRSEVLVQKEMGKLKLSGYTSRNKREKKRVIFLITPKGHKKDYQSKLIYSVYE